MVEMKTHDGVNTTCCLLFFLLSQIIFQLMDSLTFVVKRFSDISTDSGCFNNNMNSFKTKLH